MGNTFNEWVELRELDDTAGAQGLDQQASAQKMAMGLYKDIRQRAKRQAFALTSVIKGMETLASDPKKAAAVLRVINLMRQNLQSEPELAAALAKAKQPILQMGRQAAPDPEPGMPTARPGYGGAGSMLAAGQPR